MRRNAASILGPESRWDKKRQLMKTMIVKILKVRVMNMQRFMFRLPPLPMASFVSIPMMSVGD
jgi:hypothetical protein